LKPPEFPNVIGHIWHYFWEMNNQRSIGEAGIAPIPFSEILSWSRLHKIELTPFEVETLTALDRLYIEIVSETF